VQAWNRPSLTQRALVRGGDGIDDGNQALVLCERSVVAQYNSLCQCTAPLHSSGVPTMATEHIHDLLWIDSFIKTCAEMVVDKGASAGRPTKVVPVAILQYFFLWCFMLYVLV
jgi:hypothetical protein